MRCVFMRLHNYKEPQVLLLEMSRQKTTHLGVSVVVLGSLKQIGNINTAANDISVIRVVLYCDRNKESR